MAVCWSLEQPLASIELTPIARHERAKKPSCPAAARAQTTSQAAGMGNSERKKKKAQNPLGHKT